MSEGKGKSEKSAKDPDAGQKSEQEPDAPKAEGEKEKSKKATSKASSKKNIEENPENGSKPDREPSADSKKSRKSKKKSILGPQEDLALKEDAPGPIDVPVSQYKSFVKPSDKQKQPDLPNTSFTNLGSLSKMSFNAANSQQLDLANINEIRKKREEERLKEMTFFKNQRQAQIAKMLEEKQKVKQVELQKEHKRKRRHSHLKKEIVSFKQAQTERRKSIDEQYTSYIAENYKKRMLEISKMLKRSRKEYVSQFAKEHQRYLKKQKEKEMKKAIQERGVSKGDFTNKPNKIKPEDWEEIKKDRALEDKIFNMFYSGEIEDIFHAQDRELLEVYNYYSRVVVHPEEHRLTGAGATMPMRNFFLFANQFEFLNTVLDVADLKLVYRSVTKNKRIHRTVPLALSPEERKQVLQAFSQGLPVDLHKRQQASIPAGLTFEGFKMCLFRVVLKRTVYFSKVAPPEELKYKKQPNIDFVDIFDPGFTDFEDAKDEYPDIDTFHYSHLDGLFNFLDLPSDPADLARKLDQLRAAYHHAKPDRAKERPKKAIYEKIHTAKSASAALDCSCSNSADSRCSSASSGQPARSRNPPCWPSPPSSSPPTSQPAL